MSKRLSRIDPVCLTCLAAVRWEYDESKRAWVAFDFGTKHVHVCAKGE